MAVVKDQTLPSKEANLFRQVVKCYESKQYKKGIKAADQVKHVVPFHYIYIEYKSVCLLDIKV